MRYLRRVSPRSADVADLRQEVYVRVYEGAAKSLPQHPQRFLFVTARNLLIDRQRRERVVSIDYTQDLESLHVTIDEPVRWGDRAWTAERLRKSPPDGS
jgi:DNA-directed RNA polymerase specialized sigma24 family protein